MPVFNDADALYAGASAVDKAYLGSTQVWAPPSSGFDFDSLANLELWLDPAQGLSGGNLLDRSGNTRDATVSGATIASNMLRCNGSSGYALVDEGTSFITGDAISMYVVANRLSMASSFEGTASVYESIAANDYGSTNGAVIGEEGFDTDRQALVRAGDKAALATNVANNTKYLLVARWDGTDSYLSRVTSGGTEDATPVASPGAFAIGAVLLGARWTGSVSNFSQIDYGAVLLYSDFKSGSDDTAIRSALVSEWEI